MLIQFSFLCFIANGLTFFSNQGLENSSLTRSTIGLRILKPLGPNRTILWYTEKDGDLMKMSNRGGHLKRIVKRDSQLFRIFKRDGDQWIEYKDVKFAMPRKWNHKNLLKI